MQSTLNDFTNLIDLINRRKTHKPRRSKSSNRAIRIIGRAQNVTLRNPIFGDYAIFLENISTYSLETTDQATCLVFVRGEQFEKHYLAARTIIGVPVTHGLTDHAGISDLPARIQKLIASAAEAVDAIESNTGKTGGAAIKRRGRAIQQFKRSKQDFNLLLSASRAAVSSTMRLRRKLQDSSEDETIYIEVNEETRSYKSKDYPVNLNSIETILNRDVASALNCYKIIKSRLEHFNSIVAEFNQLIQHSDDPTIHLTSPSELTSLLANL